jgi:hypothetical protein
MPANITFSKITGGRDVYSPEGMRFEDIAVSGASASGAITSEIGDFLRITTNEDCYVLVGDSPTVAVGDGFLLLPGQVIAVGPVPVGSSVAVIAA